MIAIAIYVGLFVWGMTVARLRWWHPLALIGIAIIWTVGVFYLIGGFEMLQRGATSGLQLAQAILLELLLDCVVFFAGYGVGRWRRRGQVAEDVADTFS
jgi:hypothetical protein